MSSYSLQFTPQVHAVAAYLVTFDTVALPMTDIPVLNHAIQMERLIASTTF